MIYMNNNLLISYRNITLSVGEHIYLNKTHDSGLSFSLLTINETIAISSDNTTETAIVLLNGSGIIDYHDKKISYFRNNWINENPHVIHISSNDSVTIHSNDITRFAIIRTNNPLSFQGKIYTPNEISVEHRGKDILDNTCYRLVRQAFDKNNATYSNLVIGEVMAFPGKWSSYPPHHHKQPELYYYEFSPSYGYGHGELGEDVYKIYHQDLLVIDQNRDHSQVAAPGYNMYYLWAIRHLPNNPYSGFEYTAHHGDLVKKRR